MPITVPDAFNRRTAPGKHFYHQRIQGKPSGHPTIKNSYPEPYAQKSGDRDAASPNVK